MLIRILFIALFISYCGESIAVERCSFIFNPEDGYVYHEYARKYDEYYYIATGPTTIHYLERYSKFPLDMKMRCLYDKETCRSDYEYYIVGNDKFQKKDVDKIFIPLKGDDTIYKYSNDIYVVYFSSRPTAGYYTEPWMFFSATFIDRKECRRAVSLSIGAKKQLIRKHESKILRTINSIRFVDDQ